MTITPATRAANLATAGLGFTQSLYERERYEEVLHVAGDIKAAADEALEVRREQDHGDHCCRREFVMDVVQDRQQHRSLPAA